MYICFNTLIILCGNRKIFQWLKVLVVLPEEQVLFPASHDNLQLSYALFWPPWALVTHMMLRNTCRQNTHIHKIKINKFSKKGKVRKN